jgi:hypothetical protein
VGGVRELGCYVGIVLHQREFKHFFAEARGHVAQALKICLVGHFLARKRLLTSQDARIFVRFVFHPSLSRSWMARSNSAGSPTSSSSDRSRGSLTSVYLLLICTGRPRKVLMAF